MISGNGWGLSFPDIYLTAVEKPPEKTSTRKTDSTGDRIRARQVRGNDVTPRPQRWSYLFLVSWLRVCGFLHPHPTWAFRACNENDSNLRKYFKGFLLINHSTSNRTIFEHHVTNFYETFYGQSTNKNTHRQFLLSSQSITLTVKKYQNFEKSAQRPLQFDKNLCHHLKKNRIYLLKS